MTVDTQFQQWNVRFATVLLLKPFQVIDDGCILIFLAENKVPENLSVNEHSTQMASLAPHTPILFSREKIKPNFQIFQVKPNRFMESFKIKKQLAIKTLNNYIQSWE